MRISLLLLALGAIHFTAACAEDRRTIPAWQTYCAVPNDTFTGGQAGTDLDVEPVFVLGERSHSMFAFAADDGIRLRDLNSGRQWQLRYGRFETARALRCKPFAAFGVEVSHSDDAVTACRGDNCQSIEIKQGTFVFAYAAARSAIVAITNYGDALLFRDDQWCRMTWSEDRYTCIGNEPMVTEPRKMQFYSSIRYDGETLMGEWPTGRLFVFDGRTIEPWSEQPPHVSKERTGFEAQAMAVYCGDLYVGYWPTGAIWRLHRRTGEWSRIALFPDAATFYPHIDRPADDLSGRFFGRRVTALLPHDGSLYAATSNLLGWHRDLDQSVVSDIEAEFYGKTHRLTVDCTR